MDVMSASLDAGKIDFKTYSDAVAAYLKNMFEQGKISAKEYYEYTSQILDKQKDAYDAAHRAVLNLLDAEIEKYQDLIDGVEDLNDALADQKTQMENAADAVTAYYDILIEEQQDVISGQEEQLNKLDAIANVADHLYEEEQEKLKAQQDALQDRIDAINNENDALDLQLQKEQALIELDRAKNTRTRYLYSGEERGFIYDTDQDAVRDAKNNLQDIETDILIDSLEREKEALNESIDALQAYRDKIADAAEAHNRFMDEQTVIEMLGEDYANQILGADLDAWDGLGDAYIANNKLIQKCEDDIKALEQEQDAWESLSGVIADETNRQAATMIFGADWMQQINDGRLISFEDFKVQYLDIQAQIDDNTALIESYNEKITYYNGLKENWNDVVTTYEEGEQRRYAAMIMGQNWEADVLSGRLDTLTSFKEQYCQIQDAITEKAYQAAEAQRELQKVVSEGANITTPTTTAVGFNPNVKRTKYEAYADGTTNAKRGLNLVGEDGPETYIDNDGNVSLITRPALIPMEGGETVIDNSATKDLIINGRILTPATIENVSPSMAKLMTAMGYGGIQGERVPKMPITYVPSQQPIVENYKTMELIQKPERNVTVQLGDINLHGVQDIDSFSKQIKMRMPGIVTQMINKR